MAFNKENLKWIIPTAIASSLVLGLGLYSLKLKKEYELLMSYCYKIANFKIGSISKDNLSFGLVVKFQNKSNFGFNIKSYLLNVYINGKYVAFVKSDIPQKVLPNAVSDLKVDVNITPKEKFTPNEIMNLAAYALVDKDNFIITIDGKVTAKFGFITLPLPVKFTYTLKELLADDETAEKCNL